ncbi:tripartite tricarboxylate transporter permease [Bengtsoniella intestinalis]|uniref:tripartite tricarboxylate transporter permease n=1 Tax=Bengtsoniella intestinalis TaxID=3073143 RepID=UPI00391F9226
MQEFTNVALELVQPINLFLMNIGLAVGVTVGALPGLNPVIAITLLLPFTYALDSIGAILLLLGAYCGSIYGGSITAILINTPGTGSAMATMIDGYPLAQQGRAGDALKSALVASVFGGIFSCICLIFFAPTISSFALQFHSADYFSLCLFGLCMVVSVSGGNICKGLITAGIGLLISSIGIDTMDGIARFTFGKLELLAGIPVICVMMGAFALGNVFIKCYNQEKRIVSDGLEFQKPTVKVLPLIRENLLLLIRSSALGSFIGAVPGTGGSLAAYMSYNIQVSSAKTEEEKASYGKGNIQGVMAPESANNAITGATLIPMLTLGIPGDGVVAVIASALFIHGISPGPSLFTENPFWVYCLMGGLLVINIFMFLQGSFFIKAFANVTKLPMVILLPSIVMLCVVGAYTARQYIFDVTLIMVFGLLGYILHRLDFPLQPMTIGIVLGALCERNFRRALIINDGSLSIFFTRPLSLFFLFICVFSLLYPQIKKYMKNKKGRVVS